MSRKPIKQSTIKKRAALATKPTPPRQPQEPEIDFSAALPTTDPTPTPNPYIDYNISIEDTYNKDLYKGIGGSNIDNNNNNNLSGINNSSNDELLNIEEIKSIEDKTELKPRETKVLEYYFGGNISIEAAVKKAGYKAKDPQSRGIIGKRILEKYVSRVGDHKKIFRELGYSEVKIALLLIDSAEKAQSETVKLNARIALAKCLGMQREVIDGEGGVNIVFYPQGQGPAGPAVAGKSPKPEPLALPEPHRKLHIIK